MGTIIADLAIFTTNPVFKGILSNLIFIILLLFAIGWSIPRFIYPILAQKYNWHNLSTEQKIADFLKQNSAPTDKVLVWGVSPAIYVLADRLPATRYLWSDTLVGRLPGIPASQLGKIDSSQFINKESWKFFLEDIKNSNPKFIIDCASGNLRDYASFPMEKFQEMNEIIKSQYLVETKINGINIYIRK